MNQLIRRLRYLLNRRRFDQELASDMDFHREMTQNKTDFGNSLKLREESRDAWGWTWIDRLSQDLRYAARKLRKSPGFTVAAVLMLALGIGANVAAFSFLNILMFKPIPIRDPSTLLRFERRSPQSFASDLPYPEVAFFREYSRTLSAVIALEGSKLTIDGEEKPLLAHFVTPNFFRELGATTVLGRSFEGTEPLVVLSYGFWKRHFGADPLIIGKTIHLNNKPATVIGVASNEFSGLSMENPDLWAPIDQQPYFLDGSKLLTDFPEDGSGVKMFGRLQPGFTPQAAEKELHALAAQLRQKEPKAIWENETLPAVSAAFVNNVTGSRRGSGSGESNEAYPVIALVGALVLLILAVACGNLGSLLLARGVAREREIAIRISVGAGRSRLIRQLFTESLLLALLGSMAGLAVGYAVFRALATSSDIPAWVNPSPDWRVILFSLSIGFTSAIVFGLTPALQLARQRQNATGPSQALRQALIGAQVAGSCVLLIVAGLLVRALEKGLTAHPGYEYQQVVSIEPSLAHHGYSPAAARAYFDALENRLRGVPGIQSTSLAAFAPLGSGVSTLGTTIKGRPIEVHINNVDPRFFETMSIPMLRGRDVRANAKEVVVSDTLARTAWPGENPLGKLFPPDGGDHTVVGVVANARLVAIQDAGAVEAYFASSADDMPSMFLLVKTAGPPEGLVPFVASIARSTNPKVLPQVQLLKSSFRERISGTERSAFAVSMLGLVALLLACCGIVGLVAYAVSQRTKEIGIRMALGARPQNVLSLVLRQLSKPVLIGFVVGIGLAAALSQLLRRELFGINHLDPITYVSAVVIFALSIAVAAVLPARQALRVDPLSALRQD